MLPKETIYNVVLPSLVVMAVVLYYLSARTSSPIIAIFARWIRWVFISLVIASVLEITGIVDRPFWVLAATGFLGWCLVETLYNWLAIDAMSKSNFPLFPRFKANDKGGEWPNEEGFIRLRERIRHAAFTKVAALIAEFDEHFAVRSVVFTNPERNIRLQVTFFPYRAGSLATSFSFTSILSDGTRLITDNHYMPYGGFYPDNWSIERKPWTRTFGALLQRHLERMDATGKPFEFISADPLSDINEQQASLERLNYELGFLTPAHKQEESGRISYAGRYRVWKELWLLSYFGIAVAK